MKTVVLLTTMVASLMAFAGQENYGLGQEKYNAQQIYSALKVKEVAVNAGIAGVGRFQKSVGGLTCEKSQVIVPNAPVEFSCDIDNSKENFAAIYKALNVKEVAVNPGIVGSSRKIKSVGGLTCEKFQVIVPNAKITYSCQIAE